MENKDQKENSENINFKELINLLNQLKVLKDQRRALEQAIAEKRREKINEMIAESGSIYQGKKAEINRLQEIYKTALENAQNTYGEYKDELRAQKEQYESELVGYEGDLTESKVKLNNLKKEPFVKQYEEVYNRNYNIRMKLIKKLDKTNDEVEIKYLKSEIKDINETLKRNRESFYKTDVGKSYKELEDKKIMAEDGIYATKNNIAEVNEKDENLDNDYKEWVKKIENSKKEKIGMVKTNKLQTFIGGIRAKLGIGKHKEEKNVKDTLNSAINVANNFINSVKEKGKNAMMNVKNVADKGMDKVQTFAKNRESDVIRKLTQLAKDNIQKQTEKNKKLEEKNHGGVEIG